MGKVIRVAAGEGGALQDALDAAAPGDTVLLCRGEHRHHATIRHGSGLN